MVLTGGLIANDQSDLLVRVDGGAKSILSVREKTTQRIPGCSHTEMMYVCIESLVVADIRRQPQAMT